MTANRVSRVIIAIGERANVKVGMRKNHSKTGEASENVPQFAGATATGELSERDGRRVCPLTSFKN